MTFLTPELSVSLLVQLFNCARLEKDLSVRPHRPVLCIWDNTALNMHPLLCGSSGMLFGCMVSVVKELVSS